MSKAEKRIHELLIKRSEKSLLRKLKLPDHSLIDFYSNDYLGFVKNSLIKVNSEFQLKTGSTGSRLLSGNYIEIENLEEKIANFHNAESALMFNSGYNANLGFFSCVPQKDDFIFYDELVHASIIDGLRLSHAKSIKFKHNNLDDLIKKINLQNISDQIIYVAVESVYSMDGDVCNLKEFSSFCTSRGYHLVVDEAHASGIYGPKGEGLCFSEGVHHNCFARIITYGKAFGVHGASILGSNILKKFLINYSRPLIYSTSLPQNSIFHLDSAYDEIAKSASNQRDKLFKNIKYFSERFRHLNGYQFNEKSPIQTIIFSGNKMIDNIANQLNHKGFDIRAIKSPTVPEGKERLRVCLHSFNTQQEINNLFLALSEI